MRCYVLCASDEATIRPYILAEVVRATGDEGTTSFAASIAGPRSEILTREELLRTEDGRNALTRWEADDDSSFDDESALLEVRDGVTAARKRKMRMHLVADIPHAPDGDRA